MIISWEPDIPQDVRVIVDIHLQKWMGLLPTWVQEFIVRYDPKQPGRMAAKINYSNRWAMLVVTADWIGEVVEEREAALVHEFIHVNLEPLAAPICRIIEDLTEKESKLRSLILTAVK